jgi:hypothetical protein
MKSAILVIICSLVLVGCSESPKPIDSGTPISGTVWKHSLRGEAGENLGAPIPQDAKVDVFEKLIIIHLTDGSRQIVPLDCVSDLKIK